MGALAIGTGRGTAVGAMVAPTTGSDEDTMEGVGGIVMMFKL
jgi:hypothetical protein